MPPDQTKLAVSNLKKNSRSSESAPFFRLAVRSFSRAQTGFHPRFHRENLMVQTENRAEIGFLSGLLTGFLFRNSLSQSESTRCANRRRKSGREPKRGKGGSDPTLFDFQPPKNPWDRSRPFSKPLARVRASERTFCNAICSRTLMRKRCAISEIAVEEPKTIHTQSTANLRAARFVFYFFG